MIVPPDAAHSQRSEQDDDRRHPAHHEEVRVRNGGGHVHQEVGGLTTHFADLRKQCGEGGLGSDRADTTAQTLVGIQG